jgi:large subunit ribosomal protein L25
MEKITLKAKARKEVGRKVKLLRKEGILPANIYGKKIKSESIQVDLKEFLEVYKKVGDTKLFYINERPVLVANIQKNPVSDMLLHIDFHQVDLKEKVEAKVPVELIG